MMGSKITDRYIRYVKDIPDPPRGLSVLDFSRVRPGPNISLVKEMGQAEEQRTYSKDSGELLCRGAAVGLDGNGLCRHIWPYFAPQLFCGFVLGNSESGPGKNDRVVVMSRGAVFLTIPGVCVGDEGRAVFAYGPNSFTLDRSEGSIEIGVVRFAQPDTRDRASVVFSRWNLAISEKNLI